MAKNWFQSTRKQALGLILVQFLVLTVIALILLLINGLQQGYSFWLGGMVSILPGLYFTQQLFRETKPSAAKRIVKRFYRNEFVKLILMSALFLMIVKFIPVRLLPFIIGLIIAQMGTWFAPILFLSKYEVMRK